MNVDSQIGKSTLSRYMDYERRRVKRFVGLLKYSTRFGLLYSLCVTLMAIALLLLTAEWLKLAMAITALVPPCLMAYWYRRRQSALYEFPRCMEPAIKTLAKESAAPVLALIPELEQAWRSVRVLMDLRGSGPNAYIVGAQGIVYLVISVDLFHLARVEKGFCTGDFAA